MSDSCSSHPRPDSDPNSLFSGKGLETSAESKGFTYHAVLFFEDLVLGDVKRNQFHSSGPIARRILSRERLFDLLNWREIGLQIRRVARLDLQFGLLMRHDEVV